MRTRALITTIVAIGLSACGPIRMPGDEVEVETPVGEFEVETDVAEAETLEVADDVQPANVATVTRAEIDWDAARSDFAARPVTDGNAFTIASENAPPVPVLLPSAPVSVASDGDDGVQFRPLNDGYYAVYPGDAYDMIINGTDRLAAAPGRSGTASDTDLRFEETITGAQVAFSRYGASYLVEFACKSDEAVTGDGCINEADAKAAVTDLLLAGTR